MDSTKEERRRFMRLSRQLGKEETIMCRYIRSGSRLSVTWLREQGYHWGKWSINRSVRAGDLNMVKCLANLGCPHDNLSLYWAKVYHHREVVEWLEANSNRRK